MKILFLTPQLPYPPHQGTTIRNYNLIRHLAAQHTIDLLTFVAPDQQVDSDSPLYRACRRIGGLSQPIRSLCQRGVDTLRSPLPDMALRLESGEMHELVCSWLQDGYDIVQIEGIEMAQYGFHALTSFLAGSAGSDKRPLLIFDDHNCEYLLQKRNALTDLRRPKRWPAALYSLIQWQKLRHYERQICQRADAVLAVSSVDQQALEGLAHGIQATVIANGIDAIQVEAQDDAQPAKKSILLFTGKMDYRPNIDAVLWFAEAVLPLILEVVPEARFQIVGMNPHPRLDGLRQHPAIEITGAVETIDPYLQAATVYVVPLRVGGGTRFKVLEAMVHGKPIVSTSLGVEGIAVQDGVELLLADTPQTFADAVICLLQDVAQGQTLGHQLGERARHFVLAAYSWQHIVPRLEALYAGLRAGNG